MFSLRDAGADGGQDCTGALRSLRPLDRQADTHNAGSRWPDDRMQQKTLHAYAVQAMSTEIQRFGETANRSIVLNF